MNNNLPKNCWECPFFRDPDTCINADRHATGHITPEFRMADSPLRPAWCPLNKEETYGNSVKR